jgi:hypothetical protein
MIPLIVRILYILLAIAITVGCYYLIIWVLGLLGIIIPVQILRVIFVIIGLGLAIAALTGRLKWPD